MYESLASFTNSSVPQTKMDHKRRWGHDNKFWLFSNAEMKVRDAKNVSRFHDVFLVFMFASLVMALNKSSKNCIFYNILFMPVSESFSCTLSETGMVYKGQFCSENRFVLVWATV